jgi:hypothetical protein
MSLEMLKLQATTSRSYSAFYSATPVAAQLRGFYGAEVTQIHLSKSRLDWLAARYQPPQSWYDEDLDDLFS